MSRKRRTFTAEQKAETVRRHVSGKEAVSDLADELGVQPTQIHTWVKQRSKGSGRGDQAKDQRIEQLQAKLADKHEVISELMEENVKAKKANGEL
jgi:transposase-like protein